MSLTIPLRSDAPHYSFEVELDGLQFTLTLLWNVIASAWYMYIADADGLVIVEGVRLVEGPLTWRFKDSRLPPGLLMMTDTTGAQRDPFYEDLGKRHLLLYFSTDEIAGT